MASRRDRQQNKHLSNVTAVTLLYLLLTMVMTWPMVSNFSKAIPGDGFDGWQNYWNLWWVKVALVERLQNPFQTDLLYAPTGVDLYFHTLNPFNGLATLPIQLSNGLLEAYNSVVLLSWTLGGLGVFLLTRWVLRTPSTISPTQGARLARTLPPFLAGLIFTFSPFHMAHLLGHMQVMSLQWIPFYILYLMRSLDQRRNGLPWVRSALLAGLFLVLCGLCDWYFVLYLFFFTGLLVLWHLLADILRTRQLFKAISTWVPSSIVAGLCFLILLSPILIPMIQTASQLSFMVRPESDFYILSASLADFLIPNRLHTLFRNDSFGWIGNQIAPVSERTISIGYVALLLSFWAMAKDRKRAGFWFGAALFFLLMALGPVVRFGDILWSHIPADPALELPPELASLLAPAETVSGRWSLFGVLNQVIPFMEISRSVSRYALMVQLCVSVLAGVGLSSLLTASKRAQHTQKLHSPQQPTVPSSPRFRPAGILLASLLPVLVLFEYWVAPFPLSPPDTPAVYAESTYFGDGQPSLLNLPMNYDRPGYLLYQTVHQRPLAVAYISRDDPRTFTERVPALQHFRHLGNDILDVDPGAVGLTVFHDLGIGTVILDRYKMPGGHEREYTTALAQAIFVGEPPAFEDDRITIYQVPPLEQRKSYLAFGPLNWGALRDYDGIAARSILDGPAQLWIYPGTDAATMANRSLKIRYRSQNNVAAMVFGENGTQVSLPPTQERAEMTVYLGDLLSPQVPSATEPIVLKILADAPGAVYIELIGLNE